MSEPGAVPLLLHSPTPEPVAALKDALRTMGIKAQCTWISAFEELADGLEQVNPELLLYCPGAVNDLAALAALRDQVAHTVPLVVVRAQADEAQISRDLVLGANDSVSLQFPERIHAVLLRELHAHRLARTLNDTLRTSSAYRSQLEAVLQRSNDAIAQVQEGLLVDANAAWLELFAVTDREQLLHQPVMDLFDATTHAPLQAALTACQQGKWGNLPLGVRALLRDGSVLPFDLTLTAGDFAAQPSVRLIVAARKRDDESLARDMHDAVRRDAVTGLLTRRYVLEAIAERFATPVSGGVRYLAAIRPDKFATIERDVGVVASETFLVAFSNIVRALLGPRDIAGRFAGNTFLLLLERGNVRDIEAWSEQLIERVARHGFQIGAHDLHGTCTIGLSVVPREGPDVDRSALDALEALRRGRARGGNQAVALDNADTDTRVQAYDGVWVRHIKAALVENRFRLVQQPLAALTGAELQMFDVAVRMLDPMGREVLPSEFLPAAGRNQLMRPIDRWVLAAAAALAARRELDLLFVRVSLDFAIDPALPQWLALQLATAKCEPSRLCLQLAEQAAATQLPQIARLAAELHEHGVRFALEHFGSGRGSESLIDTLPIDYVKIDGALMQGIATSDDLRQRVRVLVDAAKAHGVQTVAERVEDANTMAVVWQLGVQYIQGYLVHAPEQVVLQS